MVAFRIFGKHTDLSSFGEVSINIPGVENKKRVFSGVCFREYNPSGTKVVRDFQKFPLLVPNEKQIKKYINGFYDPRLSKIGNRYLLTVVGVNHDEYNLPEKFRHNFQIPLIGFNHTLLFITNNFEHFKYFGKIGPKEYDKNMFFLNKKIKHQDKRWYVLFHRYKNSVQIRLIKKLNELKDVHAWNKYIKNYKKYILISPKYSWEGVTKHYPGQVGGVSSPIPFQYEKSDPYRLNLLHLNLRLPTYYLMFYNSVIGSPDNPAWGRSVGAIIFSENAPSAETPFNIISRSPTAILEPVLSIDKHKENGNIVYGTGTLVSNDGKYIDLYFGAGDKYPAIARFNAEKLINYLMTNCKNL